jgi:hypothetical protein
LPGNAPVALVIVARLRLAGTPQASSVVQGSIVER